MSTLVNISYSDGDVVWVRLSNSWWPGEVVGESRLPEGLLASLKKEPIAVVRFFQEDTYEYVYSIDKICLYNNQRKHTFIKKGLEAFRAKKKFMETFPEDVAIAERMVNGDPDIINSEEFQSTKAKKEAWSDIFIDPNKKQKTPKKDSPGQITHHRNSDHEVRILEQSQTPKTPASSSENSYRCRACPFSTNRMNVFILHNKTHTKDELTQSKTPIKATPKSKTAAKEIVTTPKVARTLEKSLREPKKTPIIDDFVDDYLSGSDTEETPAKKKRRGGKKTPAKAQTPVKKSQRNAKTAETKEPEEPKINTEIKNELLADWSDDEVAPESALVVPDEPKTKPVKKLSDKKSSELFDNLKKDEEEVKHETNASPSPIKCRNIPKKRDFVFDDLKEETVDEKKKEKEDKKREKDEEKRKREEEKQREIERIIREKVEKQKEKEEKRKEQEEKRKQQLEEKRKLKEEKKKQQELKKREEEAQKQAELEKQRIEEEQKQAELERQKAEQEQKRFDEEKKKAEAKKKMKGDFDLLMEQLEETIPPVRVSRRNKNKRSSTETPVKQQQKIESPTPEANKSSRKSARRGGIEPTKSAEPEIGEDEALAQEIKELLKETAVPDLLKEPESDDRKLPPKERGKRIFKESKGQLEAQTKSPSKAMTESELLIAETLTQLPQTAIQFSPKKTLPSKSHTSNDNDVAESLINLSSPPKAVSSVPEPVTSNSSPIVNPRKRHLRALEEKSIVGEVVEEKVEPKHEHLTKRQRMILEAQNAKAVESPTKSETRLPKKRKSEYQSEFESVVNKKLEEDKRQATVPEKKTARSSARQTSKDVDEGLFDINNMEIVFDNEPISSPEAPKVRHTVSLSPIKITKPVAGSTKAIVSSSKVISSPTKTIITRTEPQIIKITQDNRVTRLSPIPQTMTLKNAEIRRLSFPTTGTKEQKLRQEVTPTHRKVMKLITQPDGTKTLIEEVQPNIARTSPTTHNPLTTRASSSSPLAKPQRSMTQSPILSTPRGNVTPKPQVIVGGASNKIIITSKGSLMTTTSPVTSTTARMSSNIRPANKIQVQSEIIIPSSRVTSRVYENIPVTTTVRKEVVYSSQKKPITTVQGPRTTVVAPPTTSKDKPKTNVIKLSPQQLQEAESLGYVEVRGNGKVLTKAGLREYLPTINPNYKLKRKHSDSSSTSSSLGPSSSTSSIESQIERQKSSDSSIICLDADESPQKTPPVTQQKQKPMYKAINNDPIVIPDEEPEQTSTVVQKATSPSIKKVDEKPASVPETESPVKPTVNTPPVVSESPSKETPIAPVSTPTPTKENSNLNDQNTQILAVPAENFGGPTNAFYLCSVNEDGTFTPMNNEALYLDASNQLVPMMPETQEKSDAGQDDATGGIGDDNTDAGTDVGGQSIILNTGDGQQIILDQQSLLAMAVSGDVSQLFTQDGQQLILPGSAQEILNAIAASQNELGDQPILIQAPLGDQDILATALANTEVFQQDQLLAGSLGDLNPPVKAHVSETNTVLTQSPIMSTTEQPTKNNGNVEKVSSELSKNLDEKLAEIGVTQHQTNVPVSLELPITVTNPAIAPKTTTNPLEINSIYPATSLGVAVSSTLSSQELSPALVGVTLPQSTTPLPDDQVECSATTETADEQVPPTSEILNAEISDEFIPDTPDASNHQTQDIEDTNSSEIPLQPNVVTQDTQERIDLKNNGDITETHDELSMEDTELATNGVDENSINNNSEEKQEFMAPLDICDIPLPDETPGPQQQSSSDNLQTLNEQMEVEES